MEGRIIASTAGLLKCNDHSAVGGNANWCSHYGEPYGASLKEKQTNKNTLKTELPYTLAIPLLGMYLEKIVIQKDTYTPIFTTALLTTAKTQKQLRVHRQMNE